ncbi:hypothetical protein OIE71_04500 [Streptomyces sp. NBC_01725]|uniref:hypothetical protein n=1 Tax=Streptomyces sp. NBC_01725 TaxID=2975923 RepID=UPI002E293F00|nr:hypothetical protein [Streptomyces sp. NBC_01725]
MSAQPIEPPPPGRRLPRRKDNRRTDYGAISDNRLSVQVLIDAYGLPAPTVVARPLVVHVSVADPDDVAAWMYALGGEIRRGIEIDGASLWTLRTQTPVRGDGSTVAIRVHVPVVAGEDVVAALRGAES